MTKKQKKKKNGDPAAAEKSPPFSKETATQLSPQVTTLLKQLGLDKLPQQLQEHAAKQDARITQLEKAMTEVANYLKTKGALDTDAERKTDTTHTAAPPPTSSSLPPSQPQQSGGTPENPAQSLIDLLKDPQIVQAGAQLLGGGGGESDNFYKQYVHQTLNRNLQIQDRYLDFLDVLITGEVKHRALDRLRTRTGEG